MDNFGTIDQLHAPLCPLSARTGRLCAYNVGISSGCWRWMYSTFTSPPAPSFSCLPLCMFGCACCAHCACMHLCMSERGPTLWTLTESDFISSAFDLLLYEGFPSRLSSASGHLCCPVKGVPP